MFMYSKLLVAYKNLFKYYVYYYHDSKSTIIITIVVKLSRQ